MQYHLFFCSLQLYDYEESIISFLDVEHVSEYFTVDTYVVNKENVDRQGRVRSYEE